MAQRDESQSRTFDYPIGRGYGHDYMRGGEVLGGYGYSEREEYVRTRGELRQEHDAAEEPKARDEDSDAPPAA